VLADLGAVIVRANMPTAGWIGGPGTSMNVLNRNPLSRNKGNVATPPIVFLYELKRDLNLYLRRTSWPSTRRMRSGRCGSAGPVPRRKYDQRRFK